MIFAAAPKLLPLGMSLAAAGAMCAARPLTIAVHEFGHWCAATLVGYKVVRVAVGTGPTIAARRYGSTVWELRRFLFSGGHTLSYSQSSAAKKWRHALMLLGGITANAVVALALLAVLAWHIKSAGAASPSVVAILTGATLSQALSFAFSLWPQRLSGPGNVRGTDGQMLVDLYRVKDFGEQAKSQQFYTENRELMAQGRFDEAVRRCADLRRERPSDPLLFSQLQHALQRERGAREAFDYFQNHAGELEMAQPQRGAWVRANAAWHALLSEDANLLAEAGPLSEEAFEAFPTVPEIRGTRGAYLTRTNNHERALPLLLDGLRKVEDKIDRADFAHFLAHCEHGRGHADLATEYDNLAEHLRDKARRGLTLSDAAVREAVKN